VFNNWINRDDFLLVARRIREGGLKRILTRIRGTRQDRIETSWRKTEIPPTNWWDIPEVVERWNQKITGSAEQDFNDYVVETYFSGREDLEAISLGCGAGSREKRWAETGKFKRIEGYDLSKPRIESAQTMAETAGLSGILDFSVADVFSSEITRTFDVVIVEGSLHHFSPLEQILERIQKLMREDAYLLVNEFVGPTGFQWRDRQLLAINQLLADMPERLKIKWDGRSIKKRVGRPSKLCIRYGDPSEAIDSERIVPLLKSMFDPLDVRPYGGTILHMLFHEIAHNFCSDDPETKQWLQACFDTEDSLISAGELTSDFMAGVYTKRDLS
jgi:2-polyprenyl-3-methyl-5-hydroxy-6-metoxy-1,4-benzoquinol methylase